MVALQHICICSATLKGVTGVGEIIEQAGIGAVDGASVLTILVSFRTISDGPRDNYINNILAHLTGKANEELTANIGRVDWNVVRELPTEKPRFGRVPFLTRCKRPFRVVSGHLSALPGNQ